MNHPTARNYMPRGKIVRANRTHHVGPLTIDNLDRVKILFTLKCASSSMRRRVKQFFSIAQNSSTICFAVDSTESWTCLEVTGLRNDVEELAHFAQRTNCLIKWDYPIDIPIITRAAGSMPKQQ